MLPAKGAESNSSSLPWETLPCQRFSLAEVQAATCNFKEELVIGRGGFGKVYKGDISNKEDGRTVFAAIKRLESGSKYAASDFWAEIEMLSKLRHCHLVSLIGYCIDEDEMILVYEYMPYGTLEDYLHKVGGTQLSWMQRLKICVGAAHGLDYLHTGTGNQNGVIHRDVKSSNILLDDNWSCKIADFGLSEIGLTNQPSINVSAAVEGSFGYIDPEYLLTGKLSKRSDVYAFGVILFEVLSGRRAVDTNLDEEQWGLARWAQECFRKGKLDLIVDQNLRGQIFPKCLKKFSQIAARCCHNHPKERPTMAEVVVNLELAIKLQERLSSSSQHGCIMALSTKVQILFSATTVSNYAPSHTKRSRRNKIHIDDSGSSSKENSDQVQVGMHVSTRDLKMFSFDELVRATQNFRTENFLGQGDFGQVYKGWIHEKTYSPSTPQVGMVVAVKRLFPGKVNSYRLVWEWLAEYSHANIVKLLGYCLEGGKFILVYEFMENGSLASHLFKSAEPLSWFTRVKILIGAARGLAFLHATIKESSNKQFGTHNILLDGEFNSKLSYLGLELANTFPGFTSSYPSAPPETCRGEYDMKSDVFAYGVVLLEVLTGLQKYTPDWERTKENLTTCSVTYRKSEPDRSIWSMVDPRLEGNYPRKGAVILLLLARSCLQDIPKDRPSMEEVLRDVERISDIKIDITRELRPTDAELQTLKSDDPYNQRSSLPDPPPPPNPEHRRGS